MIKGKWIIAGTPLGVPYPCRCHERPPWAREWSTWSCSPAWCPCAGRPDPEGPSCCAWRVGPAEQVVAMRAWRAEKILKDRVEELDE